MIEKIKYEDLADHYKEMYGPAWSNNELLVDQLDEELHQQHKTADYINSGEAAEDAARIRRNRNRRPVQEPQAFEAVVVE